MKEAILNAMNPIEKKILEKEVQKIHIPEEPIPFDDFGKKIRYVKKIRELLDQDAELEEIKSTRAGTTKMRLHWRPTFTGMEEAVAGKMSAVGQLKPVQRSTDFFRYRNRPTWKKLQNYLSARIKIMPFRFEGFICGMNCAGPMRPIICLL